MNFSFKKHDGKTNLLQLNKQQQPKLQADTILKLTNVTKKFGHVTAVNNVSFELKKGERVGLIGANGAGKTTISELIVGLNKPTSGFVQYGFKYKELPQEKIGMQFQDSIYPSGLTVKNIITFARKLHKLTITDKEVYDLLSIFQMEDFYNRSSRSLSGGQRQKLNILLAILHKPELVILDEISTGLDLSAREEIIAFTDHILKKYNIAAILVSHHMEEIEKLCEKVIVLDAGTIVETSSIDDVVKKYGSLSKLMKKVIDAGNKRRKEASGNTNELLVGKKKVAKKPAAKKSVSKEPKAPKVPTKPTIKKDGK